MAKASKKPWAEAAQWAEAAHQGRDTLDVVPQGVTPTWPDKASWEKAERVALVQRVMAGDKSALPELRAMFAAHPNAPAVLFDAVRTLHGAMARQVSEDSNILFPELVMARQEALARDLAGEAATPLERLLCQRIATCQLTCTLLELRTAGVQGNEGRELHDRMVTRAHERLMSATLTLARVRRLLGPEIQQLNIAAAGAQQLNVAQSAANLTAPARRGTIRP